MPVPRVITSSVPLPSIAARPCTPASLATRAGRPVASCNASARAKPAHVAPRFGAVWTVPSTTTPGKPATGRGGGAAGHRRYNGAAMPTMRAAVLTGYGGVERLELRQVRRPVPSSGQLLLRVRAAGVNPIDWKIRQGRLRLLLPARFPLVL